MERAELGIGETRTAKEGVASGVRVEHPGLCLCMHLYVPDFPARWGFPILAAATFVRTLRFRLSE